MQKKRRTSYLLASLLASAVLFPPVSGRSESIDSVLSSAYMNNPELKSQRAKVRATDEEMPRARSGFRPQVSLDADVTGTRTRVDNTRGIPDTSDSNSTGGYTLNVVQPLFRGLRTINAMRVADASIYAERENLRATEQEILLRAVTAYVDVIRDRAVVRLRESNVGVLAEQLRATDDRFKVGEVTKTDVAQARASHSEAISDLNLAKANLKTSRAVFEQVVGYMPNSLDAPRPVISLLPRKLHDALHRGLEEHPSVLASVYAEMAATHQVDLIRGEMLPTVSLEGQVTRRFDPSDGVRERTDSVIRGHVTVPIYQGGEVSARVRQAKETVLQRREELNTARQAVQQEITSSWGTLESVKAQIVADKSAVSANQTALDGVREEEKVGQRTILDVLNAQQRLLNSQVTLTSSERDLVVAAYTLLAATGRLTVRELGLKVAEYVPEEHYDNVERKWIGTGVQQYDDTFDQRVLVNDHYLPRELKD